MPWPRERRTLMQSRAQAGYNDLHADVSGWTSREPVLVEMTRPEMISDSPLRTPRRHLQMNGGESVDL